MLSYEDDRVGVHGVRPGPREDRGMIQVGETPGWVFDAEDVQQAFGDFVRCPICGKMVFDEDAGAYCPHCFGRPDEAGGWQ